MTIRKAAKAKESIASEYSVSVSSVVWAGNNDFIIVCNGSEKRIKKEA